MKSYIQAELDAIGEYPNAEFEDSKLHELAVSYINILNESMEAADSYNTSNYDSLMTWQDIYNKRTIILKDILENYEVKTSDKHEDARNTILSNGKAAQKSEDVEAAFQSIADSIEFTFASDEYGNNMHGKATVSNNTGMDFKTVLFDVQMYDEAGVRTDSTTVSTNNWNNGETVVLDTYVPSGIAPATVKVVPNHYELAD